MKKRTVSHILATLFLASGAIFGTAGQTAPVTLKALDGSIDISGDLLSFDGKTYVIRTMLGELSLAQDTVICEGNACPVLEKPASTQHVILQGADTIGDGMMPLLLSGYADI